MACREVAGWTWPSCPTCRCVCDFRGDLHQHRLDRRGKGGNYFLPRLVGVAKAYELLYAEEKRIRPQGAKAGSLLSLRAASSTWREACGGVKAGARSWASPAGFVASVRFCEFARCAIALQNSLARAHHRRIDHLAPELHGARCAL